MQRTLTAAEKERLQAQLHAIHKRAQENEPLQLRLNHAGANHQPRRDWVQPPLPGLEEWVR